MPQARPIPAPHARSRGAALLITALTLVSGLALQFGRLTLGTWTDIRNTGPVLPDQAFGLIAGVACTGITVWLLSALAVSTVAALSSRSRLGIPAIRTARRIAPAAVRNAVAALLGVALVATPAVAHAASFTPQSISPTSAVNHSAHSLSPDYVSRSSGRADTPTPAGQIKLLQVLSPGWTPERPRPTAATAEKPSAEIGVVAPRPRRPVTVDDPVRHHVVVRQGDTLWSIAAQHLGPGATDREIAQEWPRWYRINRHLIGADPHRLLPGERLRSPDVITASTASEETGR